MLAEQVQLGVNQPLRSGDDYPFLKEGRPISDVLLDFSVQYDPAIHRLPLRMTVANSLATLDASQIQIEVRDADDVVVVFVGISEVQNTNTWGEYYSTIMWVDADKQAVAVLGNAYLDEVPVAINAPILLDPRACVPTLPTVTSLRVYSLLNDTVGVDIPITGDVAIRPGFNMTYGVSPPADRTGNGDRIGSEISLNAVAGGGEGVYRGCGEDERLVRSINRTEGNSGNFLLSGDDCFRIEPHVIPSGNGFELQKGVLRLSDDCVPCCDCGDYLPIYRAMERLNRRLHDTGDYLETLRDQYTSLRQPALDTIECRSRTLQVDIARSDDCELVITGSYLNTTDAKRHGVVLVFEVYEQTSPDVWTPIAPFAIPHVASRYSQSTDQINVPLQFTAPNRYMAPVECIDVDETKSIGFRIELITDNDIQVCVYEFGNAANFICHRTPSSCTRANPDFNPYP